MNAVIYHNPRCGVSRTVLAMLEATPDLKVEVIEYLKTPPDKARLRALYARAGISPRQGLRSKETLASDLDLAHVSDNALLDAMIDNPILIERPMVSTDKGVRLCRPAETVREIL